MERLIEQNICLFCEPEAAETETSHWRVLKNDFPYEGTERHLLIAPKTHTGSLLHLTADAWDDVRAAISTAAEGLSHFSVITRTGDPHYTGASVEHLHIHVVAAAQAGTLVRFNVG
jgi:ATP adenylyltransferase